MSNVLERIKKPDNFDTIPNPLNAGWMYWWLKEKGEDVSIITPKWCYKEFIEAFPHCLNDFLKIVDNTEERLVEKDLSKKLVENGVLNLLEINDDKILSKNMKRA